MNLNLDWSHYKRFSIRSKENPYLFSIACVLLSSPWIIIYYSFKTVKFVAVSPILPLVFTFFISVFLCFLILSLSLLYSLVYSFTTPHTPLLSSFFNLLVQLHFLFSSVQYPGLYYTQSFLDHSVDTLTISGRLEVN
jgi:hypothetical protein